MKPTRMIALFAALALLAGCAEVEPASRGATDVTPLAEITVGAEDAVMTAPLYDVRTVRVSVPRTLHVSEANLYYPIADIVWRGEARGDRYAQVSALFTEAADRATGAMTEGRPVVVDIEVVRFHALTEKTRYTFGGSYSLKFRIGVTDAETGAVVVAPHLVNASQPASGGQKAIEEEERGLTQKVVVTQILTDAIRADLMAPVAQPRGALPERISLLAPALTVAE